MENLSKVFSISIKTGTGPRELISFKHLSTLFLTQKIHLSSLLRTNKKLKSILEVVQQYSPEALQVLASTTVSHTHHE